jgi:rhamnogalacturonyl hydrolase YesR
MNHPLVGPALLAAITLPVPSLADAMSLPDSLRAQIVSSIGAAADYATTALLDSGGKSRCDYHMVEGKWYDYEPPWHTGQVIYGLVEAYRITGERRYLDAARRAGDWWVSLRITDHPALNGMLRAVHGDDVEYIVFATVSDGTAGLFLLSEVTGDPKYAGVAVRAGEWMKRNMKVPGLPMYYDCVDQTSGAVLTEKSPFWDERDTAPRTLYDVARPNNEGSLFKDMYETTKKEEYRKEFLDLCNGLVEYQDTLGLWMQFMPNDRRTGFVHPRFNLWYAESLLEGYQLTRDRRYLDAALHTARTYTRFQQKDGTIFYKNFVNGDATTESICGSAVAFAGIVWLRLLRAGAGDEFRRNVDRSLAWLLNNQYPAGHPDANLAGGILETRVRFRRGEVWMVNRDIATAFGLRFLADYLRWKEGK